jgi:hypothetical protein
MSIKRSSAKLVSSISNAAVAYPGIFSGRGFQQIKLRTEGRETGDLGAVAH